MPRASSTIDPTISKYLQDLALTREHEAARALRDATRGMPGEGMQISPEQGQFLALLVTMLGAQKTIEVGTYTGYSALSVALALPEDGELVACDVSEEWTAVGKPFWQQAGVSERINLRIGPASETLRGLVDGGRTGEFDFAFIDADKTGYGEYVELCFRLLRQGGVIALDNALQGGRVAESAPEDENARYLKALNEDLYADERFDASLNPIGDGVMLLRKR